MAGVNHRPVVLCARLLGGTAPPACRVADLDAAAVATRSRIVRAERRSVVGELTPRRTAAEQDGCLNIPPCLATRKRSLSCASSGRQASAARPNRYRVVEDRVDAAEALRGQVVKAGRSQRVSVRYKKGLAGEAVNVLLCARWDSLRPKSSRGICLVCFR